MCYVSEQRPAAFHDKEALYAAVATTRRAVAVPLDDAEFEFGGPLYEGYANPYDRLEPTRRYRSS